MGSTTGFLYAEPSLLEAIGKIVDLGGQFDDYNRIGTQEQVDALMLALDWAAIGGDMREALEALIHELDERQPAA